MKNRPFTTYCTAIKVIYHLSLGRKTILKVFAAEPRYFLNDKIWLALQNSRCAKLWSKFGVWVQYSRKFNSKSEITRRVKLVTVRKLDAWQNINFFLLLRNFPNDCRYQPSKAKHRQLYDVAHLVLGDAVSKPFFPIFGTAKKPWKQPKNLKSSSSNIKVIAWKMHTDGTGGRVGRSIGRSVDRSVVQSVSQSVSCSFSQSVDLSKLRRFLFTAKRFGGCCSSDWPSSDWPR